MFDVETMTDEETLAMAHEIKSEMGFRYLLMHIAIVFELA